MELETSNLIKEINKIILRIKEFLRKKETQF